MAGAAVLTEREAAYAEHVRRAKSQGISLSEYCRRNELRVGEWYQVRRELVRKGLMSRTRHEGQRNAARVISSGRRNILPLEVLHGTTKRLGYGADRTCADAVTRSARCQSA